MPPLPKSSPNKPIRILTSPTQAPCKITSDSITKLSLPRRSNLKLLGSLGVLATPFLNGLVAAIDPERAAKRAEADFKEVLSLAQQQGRASQGRLKQNLKELSRSIEKDLDKVEPDSFSISDMLTEQRR